MPVTLVRETPPLPRTSWKKKEFRVCPQALAVCKHAGCSLFQQLAQPVNYRFQEYPQARRCKYGPKDRNQKSRCFSQVDARSSRSKSGRFNQLHWHGLWKTSSAAPRFFIQRLADVSAKMTYPNDHRPAFAHLYKTGRQGLSQEGSPHFHWLYQGKCLGPCASSQLQIRD